MKPRPTIFLSGVSSEFASFRDAVADVILKKGCYPLNQSTFEVDCREIEAILRQKLDEADAVIHIVGFRYGLERNDRPADKPRRSYTQMEYDIARELEKPVYIFLSSNAAVSDADEKSEDPEATALQLAYREAILRGNYKYSPFKDKRELCELVAGIPQVVEFDFHDISRILEYAPVKLVGREDELALLNDAWLKVRRSQSPRSRVLTFVALGGEGKTSLVAKWAAELAHHNWPGCDAAFAWSFYSQGTRDYQAASSELFLNEAITFFGNERDKEFAGSAAGIYEKGQRLARIICRRRTLLILDGVEPLQYSPTSPTPGELKDAGIAALLRGLAADNNGLCIVTTRYPLPDLKAFRQTTAPEEKLRRLSRAAGVHLLKTLGLKGTTAEFETLVEDVKGHALTLTLLGSFLKRAFNGDIRQRDRVKFEKADEKVDGGHAFRTMAAYEQWLLSGTDDGRRELAVLRLLGLFDRPADFGCLQALRLEPAIAGLTESLVDLNEEDWNLTLSSLSDCGLVSIQSDRAAIDCHPLLREYFAGQLRDKQPGAGRAAHRRLYEYLCQTTRDKAQPTLEDLQPLYQAIAHGCRAGLQQETFDNVYIRRINRGNQYYSSKKLGALATELAAVANFFDEPWSRLTPNLSRDAQGDVPNQAAFYLRGLGRLGEAVEPMRLGLAAHIVQQKWLFAAVSANNLSELHLALGRVADAVSNAEQSLKYAERSGDWFQQMARRASYADALHQWGRGDDARLAFNKAEQMQSQHEAEYPRLYSLAGFKHCDLLLAESERAAWQRTLGYAGDTSHSEALSGISERAERSLKWAKMSERGSLLDVALDLLTLCRTALYETVLSRRDLLANTGNSKLGTKLDEAVNYLRRASQQQYLPSGLITRAWARFLNGAHMGLESAQEDLDEAWEIAERGPMRLHMADIHLYRARLFFREVKYPWEGLEADLKAAEKLINDCGYHRRDEELADAKRAILGS